LASVTLSSRSPESTQTPGRLRVFGFHGFGGFGRQHWLIITIVTKAEGPSHSPRETGTRQRIHNSTSTFDRQPPVYLTLAARPLEGL
jgi:hypothetical protein